MIAAINSVSPPINPEIEITELTVDTENEQFTLRFESDPGLVGFRLMASEDLDLDIEFANENEFVEISPGLYQLTTTTAGLQGLFMRVEFE